MHANIILLAGGSGQRLWPISTNAHPKQFIILPDKNLSSFQLALLRSLNISKIHNIIITANESHLALLEQQIMSLGFNVSNFNVLLEKSNQNTGKVIYDVCCFLLQKNNDHLTYFFPVDHVSAEEKDFFATILCTSDSTKINIFAQKADSASNDFGYITPGLQLANNYFQVKQFIEKPSEEILAKLDLDNIYQNLGVYLAKPSVLCQEFNALHKDLAIAFEQKISIDKIISERSQKLNFHLVDFAWHDIGSISVFYQYYGDKWFDKYLVEESAVEKFNSENGEFKLLYNNEQIRLIKL